MNTQDCTPLGCTGWISWKSKGISRACSYMIVQKHQFFGPSDGSGRDQKDHWKTGIPNKCLLPWRLGAGPEAVSQRHLWDVWERGLCERNRGPRVRVWTRQPQFLRLCDNSWCSQLLKKQTCVDYRITGSQENWKAALLRFKQLHSKIH